MPKPKAVKEAQDKVDAIRKEMGIDTEGIQANEGKEPAPIDGGEPTKKGEQPKIIPDLPPEAKEVIVAQPGTEVKDPDKKPVTPVNFEHEYQVLKGKYDKEIPRLNDSIKGLETRLATSQETIANLNELVLSLSKPTTEQKPEGDVVGSGEEGKLAVGTIAKLNPDDFDGYGAEMVDVVNMLNAVIDENVRLSKSMTDTSDLRQTVEEVKTLQADDAATRFFAALADPQTGVPTWQTINNEPWWKEWLGEQDPLSGIKRQALLDDAQNSYDASRVVNLLKQAMKDYGYTEDNGGGRPVDGDLGDEIVPDGSVGSEGTALDSFVPVTDKDLEEAKMLKIRGKITMDQFKDITRRYVLTNQQLQQGAGVG